MGGSCAGKSTTAQRLSEKLKIPVMFMDLYDPYAALDAIGISKNQRGFMFNTLVNNVNKIKKI